MRRHCGEGYHLGQQQQLLLTAFYSSHHLLVGLGFLVFTSALVQVKYKLQITPQRYTIAGFRTHLITTVFNQSLKLADVSIASRCLSQWLNGGWVARLLGSNDKSWKKDWKISVASASVQGWHLMDGDGSLHFPLKENIFLNPFHHYGHL